LQLKEPPNKNEGHEQDDSANDPLSLLQIHLCRRLDCVI
jgi:hypothetical protein